MRQLFVLGIIVAVFGLSTSYSKYGRTCRDIGCPSNQQCVMKEDSCTIYSRNNCGKYPTCQRTSNAAATCTTYICPPTQSCRMDRGQPKCFSDSGSRSGSSSGRNIPVPQPTYTKPNYPQYPSNSYGYGQTTPRPNVYDPRQNSGYGGYGGGAIGSGYPGQSVQGRYPTYNGGYSAQSGGYSGYSSQGNSHYSGYPSQTKQGGYPTQNGGYYNQNPGGYVPTGQRYSQQSSEESSNPLFDTLASIGKKFFNSI